MAASDEEYMTEIAYPPAPSYSRGSLTTSGHGQQVTKAEKRLGEHHRYKAAVTESVRRGALQARDAVDDVTYTVEDSNEQAIRNAVEIAMRPMGEIARKNVVAFNARSLATHQKSLHTLQEAIERAIIENATTNLEPPPEPEQPKGWFAKLRGV